MKQKGKLDMGKYKRHTGKKLSINVGPKIIVTIFIINISLMLKKN